MTAVEFAVILLGLAIAALAILDLPWQPLLALFVIQVALFVLAVWQRWAAR